MAAPFYDENMYILNMKNDQEAKGADLIALIERLNATDVNSIPSVSVLKQLATAIEGGKRYKSMKDFLGSSGSCPSPNRERSGLSLSAMKSLVLREKEDKSELGNDEKVRSLIQSLFDAEGDFLRRKIGSEAVTNMSTLPRDIHGAPPESFVVKLSEVIGSFKTLRKMVLFWCKVVNELRRLWSEGLHVPGVPLDEIPDLNSCLLYQQLEVINCCLTRERRRIIANESLDSVVRLSTSSVEDSPLPISMGASTPGPILYARIVTGELVLRLGADRPTELNMLETGEPIYCPVTQEGPLLTEDLIKETEELVLRTGSVGAGCSQLLSDMQAFKAANPGCILEDFVRWHSPPDWTDSEQSDEKDGSDSLSTKGQLSTRMQKSGNLWHKLWDTAKPVPAVKQVPLFEEDLAVEGILNALEDIPPSELFEQLFISLLCLGFVIAEAKLSSHENLSKAFQECKEYIVLTCQRSNWSEKVDDICQVYETVETMLSRPDEVHMKNRGEESAAEEPRSRFKRLTLNFGKDRPQRKPPLKEESPARQSFSSFFAKLSPKPKVVEETPAEEPPCPVEKEWTVV